jgi:hypothetical protein
VRPYGIILRISIAATGPLIALAANAGTSTGRMAPFPSPAHTYSMSSPRYVQLSTNRDPATHFPEIRYVPSDTNVSFDSPYSVVVLKPDVPYNFIFCEVLHTKTRTNLLAFSPQRQRIGFTEIFWPDIRPYNQLPSLAQVSTRSACQELVPNFHSTRAALHLDLFSLSGLSGPWLVSVDPNSNTRVLLDVSCRSVLTAEKINTGLDRWNQRLLGAWEQGLLMKSRDFALMNIIANFADIDDDCLQISYWPGVIK